MPSIKLSDIEATAHFYNNLGYELIHLATLKGEPIDWTEAKANFEIATRLAPDFEGAWNNLGIANSHLGNYEERSTVTKRPWRQIPSLCRRIRTWASWISCTET